MIKIYNSQISFCAKQNTPKISFQTKRELTEVEKEFNEVLLKYNTAFLNAKSQKELLKTNYSVQDRYDYEDLLKEKNNLSRQLKRIAKKAGTDYITMEMDIIEKKEYNRYAPKVARAKTISQLDEVQKLITEVPVFKDVKEVLLKIISDKRKILRNL